METTAAAGLANEKSPAGALFQDQRDRPAGTPWRVDVTG
jgi:hypothetical protein